MFRNRDRGLSNTLYWFFKVWNRAKWKIIALFWSYRCKQIANTLNVCSSLHTNEEQTCLQCTWTVVGIWNFHYASTISVRISSVVFIFFKRQMRYWFVWQEQLENSYHKFILGMTSCSAHPRHAFRFSWDPPSSLTSLCNDPYECCVLYIKPTNKFIYLNPPNHMLQTMKIFFRIVFIRRKKR